MAAEEVASEVGAVDLEAVVRARMLRGEPHVVKHRACIEQFRIEAEAAALAGKSTPGIAESDVEKVWTAIALHTTPGIPQYMHPVIALVTAGVEMDVLGIAFAEFTQAEREAVVERHPRPAQFKEEIIRAFYDGIHHRPETTFGNVKADVLADKDPSFRPENFCRVIRASAWPS